MIGYRYQFCDAFGASGVFAGAGTDAVVLLAVPVRGTAGTPVEVASGWPSAVTVNCR